MTVRVAIVDDEPLAREWIRTLAADDTDVEVVAEYGDGASAAAGLRETAVDLLFLDVQMPERDGFDVLASLGGEALPLVVFVTAFDRYAIRAFEVHALDYLLKPFDAERFRRSLGRAKQELARGGGEVSRRVAAFVAELYEARHGADRIALRADGRVTFVMLADVDWIEADDNQVLLHVGPARHVLRETLTSVERRLPRRRFLRIHRSAIVNTDRIREIQPLFRGEHALILRDGTKLTVGRKYRDNLQRFLERSL